MPSSCAGVKIVQLLHSPFPSLDSWLPGVWFSAQRPVSLSLCSNTGQEPLHHWLSSKTPMFTGPSVIAWLPSNSTVMNVLVDNNTK